MNLLKFVSAPIAVAAMFSSSAYAGLIGDSVGTRLLIPTIFDSGIQSTIVGAGDEGSFFSGGLVYDYGDSSFSLRSTVTGCGIASCSAPLPTLSLQLTSLDPGISSLVFTTALLNVSETHTSHSVTFSWTDQQINIIGTLLTANFVTVANGAVPEPMSLGLVLAGLAALGFTRLKTVSA